MGLVIYAEGVSRCIERKYHKRLRKWKFELYNSGGVFVRLEERVW